MSEILRQISTAIIGSKIADISSLTRKALDEGLDAKEILDNGLIPGMDHVGEEFKNGSMFIPEVLVSARAMQMSMDILRPCLASSGAKLAGVVVIGTVAGDLHSIGKNLVAAMMEGAGFEVHDLGVDVEPDGFVAAVKDKKPDIVGISALLTTTMQTMPDAIDALVRAGVRDQVRVVVGGAPLTASFAQRIGADGYAPNAAAAADLARQLVGA
jgi:5-methyltetrahydrofolate--homocysteine methyltransferase